MNWKRQLVVDALAGEGLEAKVGDCIPVQPESRRRATFTAARSARGIHLGFLARQSHDIVDLEQCVVLEKAISGRFDILRKLASRVLQGHEPLQLAVFACDNGLDIALGGERELDDARRNAITKWAVENSVSRVSHNGEVIIETERPVLLIAGAKLTPPPGNFAQAVAEQENRMVTLVRSHLKKSRKVVDLFSGFGTFALNIADKSAVHAVEHEKDALASLDQSVRHQSGIKKLTHEQRDLFRRPLQTRELDSFSGIIFDPPRAGAEAQAREIARSRVSKIAAISCNPSTLARDLRILVEGGYEIKSVTPIDQFLYTPHVEVVALLERKKTRPQRKIFG